MKKNIWLVAAMCVLGVSIAFGLPAPEPCKQEHLSELDQQRLCQVIEEIDEQYGEGIANCEMCLEEGMPGACGMHDATSR